MKPAILIGAVALAIGATAWHNNNMSISDIIGSKSVGLQCQMTDETTHYSKVFGEYTTSRETDQYTYVLELSGSAWRVVSRDGRSIKETMAAEAKGKTIPADAFLSPLRVTDETYVLIEPGKEDDGKYKIIKNGLFIDRVTGMVTGSLSRGSKEFGDNYDVTTTGKCSPIDINAKL